MTEYIVPLVVVNPDDLKQSVYDYMATSFPGWTPLPSQPDVRIIDAFCEIGAQIGQSVQDVLTSIFRYFGANLIGLPPIDGTPAIATVTVTFIADSPGGIIPQGDQLAVTLTDGTTAFFTWDEDTAVDPGTTTLSGLGITAVDPGTAPNGYVGTMNLVDTIDIVNTVTVEGQISAGTDPEDDDTYLARLRDELELLAPTPIVPDDFAAFARNWPGVDAATAIDGYNPADGTSNNEKMVWVAIRDAAGQPLPSGTKTDLKNDLESRREVNFVVNVGDATYHSIDVAGTGTAWPGSDPTTVHAAIIGAIQDYLNPATFGQPNNGQGKSKVWDSTDPKVRYLQVARAIEDTVGLRHIDSLTICLHSGSPGTSDITLTGVAPLPTPGTIAFTVT